MVTATFLIDDVTLVKVSGVELNNNNFPTPVIYPDTASGIYNNALGWGHINIDIQRCDSPPQKHSKLKLALATIFGIILELSI